MAYKKPTNLADILVPPPKPDETYRSVVFDREFTFVGLKSLLGASDVSKAGDRHAGLAARHELEREAARAMLSSLTLRHLYERPLTTSAGQVDAVMRVNYDIDRTRFAQLSSLTVGQLKDRLLTESPDTLAPIGSALTGVMAAAVAKLCDVHELVLLGRKLSRVSRARTTLGLRGCLSSRLQPNHPTDDLRGITLLTYWGWSLGSGDALIGVNPAVDTIDNVDAVLRHLDKLRRTAEAPTQICVLSHIKTQLACLDRGAPVEILFQSLAGTEATLTGEFDVTVELLDQGYEAISRRGMLRDLDAQAMYFETGQGSEFSYGKHDGIDMATSEALCYGLARRYDPFMVNNVTGFIGPETHLDNFEMIVANLQDHFMGKLLGLPMGMAPCYTLHSQITLEGQQMATQLLTSAGANYYMDVALNTDRMLAYFDTSGHDDQTLREVQGLETAPEFTSWAIARGIFARDSQSRLVRGPRWGDPSQFCQSPAELRALSEATGAVYGFETAGPRPANAISRQVRMNHAVGREAIQARLDANALEKTTHFRRVSTAARSKQEHLDDPALGSRLDPRDAAALKPEGNQVQVIVADGLSAPAVHANVPTIVGTLTDAFTARGIRVGQPMLVEFGRVKLAEQIQRAVGAEVTVMLIGERPGGDAQAARSLSAYLLFQPDAPRDGTQRGPAGTIGPAFEYTVLSNIHAAGIPAWEAAAVIAEKVFQILEHRAAGTRLEAILQTAV